MDTSLRYSSDSKSLRIRAKQKLPIDSKTLIQAHGELDTRTGAPSYLALIIRRFHPELAASIGVGVQSDKRDRLGYHIRGKKAIAFTSNGSIGIKVKGRCDTDKEFSERKVRGGLELVWSILDFRKDQDVRIKVGYEISEKVPYLQVRENNWTLNADANGKWNCYRSNYPVYADPKVGQFYDRYFIALCKRALRWTNPKVVILPCVGNLKALSVRIWR